MLKLILCSIRRIVYQKKEKKVPVFDVKNFWRNIQNGQNRHIHFGIDWSIEWELADIDRVNLNGPVEPV